MTEQETRVLILSEERIEQFLEDLRARGRGAQTIAQYRRSLTALLEFLPPARQIDADTLPGWKEQMREQGYAARTINARIAAANSLLSYLGQRSMQYTGRADLPEPVHPELTRAEYIRMLKAAKMLQKDRLYCLIKLFANVDLAVQDLPRVTVEAVRSGQLTSRGAALRIPNELRQELLDYARSRGVTSGSIFVTREGNTISRHNLTDSF